MVQNKTPLFSALIDHQHKNPNSYHVPGHKNGSVFPKIAGEYFSSILQIDLTELTELDDLHDANGCIHEAEVLLANLYEVEKSFFLVNGSTVGNLAMILATVNKNDCVLVQRNCHKSIMNGLQLAGANPVFMEPLFDEEVKVAGHVPFETVKDCIDKFRDTKAIILTNPNYYGMSYHLGEMITYAHQAKIPVLIDEAHGAHFVLGDPFPKSATQLGADVIVQSAHKTLPVMTMGSYLHVNSKIVDQEKIAFYLTMLQTSSPSYPILASLDLGRYYLATLSESEIRKLQEKVVKFKQKLQWIPKLKVVESKQRNVSTDLLKITIQSNCSLTGYQLQSYLEKEGIFVEMADPNNVLVIMPLSSKIELEPLVNKLKEVVTPYDIESKRSFSLKKTSFSTLPVSYEELKKYRKRTVTFEESIGNISANMIIPYPPGIPILNTGELVTKEHLLEIKRLREIGARFQQSSLIEEEKLKVFSIQTTNCTKGEWK